jgi:hypothetical protein
MSDLEELRCLADEFVEESRSVTEHTDKFDLESGHTPVDIESISKTQRRFC